ncbi:MAG: hypothetical protein PWQ97_468 [Tepidanaerobacteraceae bacterium]|nr:hypothetical protein [Tepidanaerobacteraceae bacterium]
MNCINRKAFEFCNILTWHKAGYTGKGVKIAHLEGNFDTALPFFDGKVLDPFNTSVAGLLNVHQQKTCDIIHQVAPDATIYTLPTSYPAKPGMIESMEFCIKEGIQLASMSLGGSTIDEVVKEEIKAYQNGVFLLKSAGNEGSRGLNELTKMEHWFSVGACHLTKDKPVRASYSSYGPELDIMALSNLYVHDAKTPGRIFTQEGTSFSSPFAAGMLALFYQWFMEAYGRFPFISEAKEFIYDNCLDLEILGFDNYTGYGLFILPPEIPEPEKADISDKEVKNSMRIELHINSNVIKVNGVQKSIDTAPFIKDNRTFVPIRFIAEEMGLKVTPVYQGGKTVSVIIEG